jgi:hypothetical protein
MCSGINTYQVYSRYGLRMSHKNLFDDTSSPFAILSITILADKLENYGRGESISILI